MSLMILALEYLLLHTIFETIRNNSMELEQNQEEKLLYGWKPLSEYQIYNIRKLTQ